jgi:hypothetical protein
MDEMAHSYWGITTNRKSWGMVTGIPVCEK